MKKVEKVSIADISFTLDDDAYVSLKQYLDSMHNYYCKDPDGVEITRDIEARIAELILGEQVYTQVVSKPLIESVVAQLGTPEEIDDEAGDDTAEFEAGAEAETGTGAGTGTGAFGASASNKPSIPRRLYRSREGRIFGGVCSGMARFWNVNVAWIRLIFIAPIILSAIADGPRWLSRYSSHHWFERVMDEWSAAFLLLYIVLLIVLPMAKTPRQKLEARGQKITPASIRQNLQESVKTPSGRKAASVVAEIINVFGRIVLFFIKFIVAVVGFSLIIAAVGCLVGIFFLIFDRSQVDVPLHILDGIRMLAPVWFAVLVDFCITLPLMVMGMALLSFVFNWKLGRWFYVPAIGIWLFAMMFCAVVIAGNARFLRDELPRRLEEYDGNGHIYFDWDDGEWEHFDGDDVWKYNDHRINDDDTNYPNRVKIRRIEETVLPDATESSTESSVEQTAVPTEPQTSEKSVGPAESQTAGPAENN